jgi:cobalt-zinc-cadmium efflux system membrane fusion protein
VVDLVGNLMDEHTRTVKIRVQVKNLEGKLRPGMFAEVEVMIPGEGRMVAVPRNAIMSDAGENFVFQHWKEDLWARRNVTVGSIYGDFAEILSGIPKGATIVTGGAFMLKSDILREKMGAGCAD